MQLLKFMQLLSKEYLQVKTREIDGELFNQWFSERPDIIQEMIKKHPPNLLYLLKSSNHRVTLVSYSEDGTITVNVSGDYNLVMFERSVFGVYPDDLVECDLPTKEEKLGYILDSDEVDEYIKSIRDKKVAPNE